ncbi:MAG: thiamine pyrophosphate-dependent enzyme [Marinilabiliales bacterium]|nr:thiamine pyrophosphate-dependent enzyme [Marinilabiliales bacterium]
MGTMGFGLPAGMGAKIGSPDKQVIAFLGDGGFQMTMQELGTILQYKIPVKIIILNNNFLGMVRQWQDMFFEKRYASTELVNPDFVTIAEGIQYTCKKVIERRRS